MSDPYHIDLYRKFNEMVAKTNLGNLDGFSSYDQDCILELYMMVIQECIEIVDRGGEFVSRPKMVERLQEHFGVKE